MPLESALERQFRGVAGRLGVGDDATMDPHLSGWFFCFLRVSDEEPGIMFCWCSCCSPCSAVDDEER